VEWLHAHARTAQVDEAALRKGELDGPLRSVWQQAVPAPVQPTGAEEVADILSAYAG
jgi:hypothetical protein